jgi:AAA15 family ATPase/GTPase
VRFASVSIENFRAISNVEITGLEDVVVIAGPNGCGKSCVLGAIRLLKSVYGG